MAILQRGNITRNIFLTDPVYYLIHVSSAPNPFSMTDVTDHTFQTTKKLYRQKSCKGEKLDKAFPFYLCWL